MKKLPGKRFEIYKHSKLTTTIREWRWRRYVNGRITHVSCEGYKNLTDCLKNMRPVHHGVTCISGKKAEKVLIMHDNVKIPKGCEWILAYVI